MSREEAAKRAGLPESELREIESEERRPSLVKFERIASAYRLPLATLFRRTPPVEPERPVDFRTLASAEPQDSFDFRVALSNVGNLQAILRVLKSEDEEFKLTKLRQYSVNGNPFEQAESERRDFGVAIAEQLDWAAGEGFRHWRARVENLGIAVYLQKFDLEDCRGFSLGTPEEGPPAIVINKTDRSVNAWTFTLIHEYAHLLVRRPGRSDLNNRNPTEAFCNRFAASFLMPLEALIQVLPDWPTRSIQWEDSTIHGAAARLKVSAQALAIRLEELERAPQDFNRHFLGRRRNLQRGQGGGNYVNTRLSELGSRFTSSVIGALDREVIDIVNASEALGLRPRHLNAVRSYVERQRGFASAG